MIDPVFLRSEARLEEGETEIAGRQAIAAVMGRMTGGVMNLGGRWGAGLTLASVVLLLAAILAGCGSSAAPDEFVGTWRQLDYRTAGSAALVIAKDDDGYLATIVYSQDAATFLLTRHGNQLAGMIKLGMGTVRAEITYLPESGHLTVSNAMSPGSPQSKLVEMTKVSSSTSISTGTP